MTAVLFQADARLLPLANESIDCCLTDPPYGISFGNLAWDTFPVDKHGKRRAFANSSKESMQQGTPFQAWTTEWASEVYRVLKPGGWLVSFAAAKSYHRMACGVEDSGFEVRDMIGWIYACLSDDTELLTEDGWVRYDRAIEGHRAAAFSLESGALKWEKIESIHVYDHAGPMVRLLSADTDQLLTLNHRVVLEDGSQKVPYIPSEEGLRGLLRQLPCDESLSVDTEQNLLAGLPERGAIGSEAGKGDAAREAQRALDCLCRVRQTSMEAERLDAEDSGADLLTALQRQATSEESSLFICPSGDVERRAESGSERSHDRPSQPGMEGRRYHFQEARELLGRPVRQSADVGSPDGEGGRIRDGASAGGGGHVRLPVDADGGCSSRESSTDGQQAGQLDALAGQQFSQALGARQDQDGRSLPSTEITASQEEYRGVVWCVTVASGAFVARRNGLIFVTGNSGFPKSLSASKAIDRHLGAVRSKVRVPAKEACNPSAPGRGQKEHSVNGRPWMLQAQIDGYYDTDSDESATPEAARWKGWGTALRPSIEPAIVARKPMPGTLAANLLEHGTGALNVDGGRLPYRNGEQAMLRNRPPASPRSIMLNTVMGGCCDEAGRWPPNVVCYGPELGTESQYYELPRNVYPCAKPSGREKGAGKTFPTVKPLDLMRWLVRLFAAPGAIILDPFIGSGTTGVAALLEGRRFIGADMDGGRFKVARARLAGADAICDEGQPVFDNPRLPGLERA